MQIARVKGSVVSTNKTEGLHGMKLLIVVPIDLTDFMEKGQPMVAVDTVGAGVGEVVMLVSGSSSRLTAMTEDKPADLVIAGIIDLIDIEGSIIFRKYDERGADQ